MRGTMLFTTSKFLTRLFPKHWEYKYFTAQNKHEHKMSKHDKIISRYICNLLNIYPTVSELVFRQTKIPPIILTYFMHPQSVLVNLT